MAIEVWVLCDDHRETGRTKAEIVTARGALGAHI